MKTFVDPVCGMTVDESAFRLEGYENVAFCAPGCRTAFLADPEGYTAEAGRLSANKTDEDQGHSHGPGRHRESLDDNAGCCGGNHRVDQNVEANHAAGNATVHETSAETS